MDETRANRGPWIIAMAILVATVAIIGFLWWSNPSECKRWQTQVERDWDALPDTLRAQIEGSFNPDSEQATTTSLMQVMNRLSPLEVYQLTAFVELLTDEQPNACDTPDIFDV